MLIRPATPADIPALVAIHNAAAITDDTGEVESAANLLHALEHQEPALAGHGLAVAEVAGSLRAYHQLRRFQQPDGLWIYSHRGFVDPAHRRQGKGTTLIEAAETRLLRLAKDAGHLDSVLSGWAYKSERDAVELLTERGYAVSRTMLEMSRSTLARTLVLPLPHGHDLRPVESGHLPAIWRAYLRAAADSVGAVADSPNAYERFMSLPQWDFGLWVVSWQEQDVSGMVLNYLDAPRGPAEPATGRTEYVNVSAPWRRRGIAHALITESLQRFRKAGVATVSLDVDLENMSAVKLYESMGYRPTRRIQILRRALMRSETAPVSQRSS